MATADDYRQAAEKMARMLADFAGTPPGMTRRRGGRGATYLDELESHLGLHERIEILYVVDGYRADLSTEDGDIIVASAEGPTLAEALSKLANLLNPDSWVRAGCERDGAEKASEQGPTSTPGDDGPAE